jgi:deoxyribodipyrimidine photolyase-related protein
MRNSNFWEFEDRPIPDAFYTGNTGLPPIDDAIKHALQTGYCHHIERLMLLGNIMQLCGFHPNRVYVWFMELFVDAYDWVMVPNVYGMSQFADGGIFTTKPYVSGSNYVRKMSDYPKGPWCEIWDGLFWSFIKKHETFFRSQYRLAMMARNLDRMAPETLAAHQHRANDFLEGLN